MILKILAPLGIRLLHHDLKPAVMKISSRFTVEADKVSLLLFLNPSEQTIETPLLTSAQPSDYYIFFPGDWFIIHPSGEMVLLVTFNFVPV